MRAVARASRSRSRRRPPPRRSAGSRDCRCGRTRAPRHANAPGNRRRSRAFVDHDVRMQHGVASDARRARRPRRRRRWSSSRRSSRVGAIVRQRMNSRRGARRLVEQRQRAREIQIRIRGNQGSQLGARTGSLIRIALARVCFTLGAYFGFARKVSWPGPACSMPATPEISISPSPASSQPSWEAISRASCYCSNTKRITCELATASAIFVGGFELHVQGSFARSR